MAKLQINYCNETIISAQYKTASITQGRQSRFSYPHRIESFAANRGLLGVNKRSFGLTLIEVLVALAIVGIAMLAVIKASSQSIRSTTYVQEKTIALWVAQQALNEVRVNVIKLPESDSINQKTEMLGQYWYTDIRQTPTPNKRIMNVSVRVFNHEDYDADDTPIIEMETYLYHA